MLYFCFNHRSLQLLICKGLSLREFKIEGRGEEVIQISHLLFADDTHIVYENDINTSISQFPIFVNFICCLISSLFQRHFYCLVFI